MIPVKTYRGFLKNHTIHTKNNCMRQDVFSFAKLNFEKLKGNNTGFYCCILEKQHKTHQTKLESATTIKLDIYPSVWYFSEMMLSTECVQYHIYKTDKYNRKEYRYIRNTYKT